MTGSSYPDAVDPDLVGTYQALAKAGGGYVWDEVLEYRVWCHPERGTPDIEDGNDYYYAFATHAEAVAFFESTEGAEEPLALIRQVEYIDEPEPGDYRHVKELQIAEWPVTFLRRPRRTPSTIRISYRRTHPRTDPISSEAWRAEAIEEQKAGQSG